MKKIVGFALGGHIATQNASFRRLAQVLEPQGYEFYGAVEGFKAFDTGLVYRLRPQDMPERTAGFVAGASRSHLDAAALERAKGFFRRGGFCAAVGSGGDDHSIQMATLGAALGEPVLVYVLNKTMDNDLGGVDGSEGAPHTDFTNGFHTAVTVGREMIRQHYAGAWTNNAVCLVGHFGRETNWVGIALAYWGHADRILYGELPEAHPGHSVENIAQMIRESQEENARRFGRRFALVVVPEGTRIAGIQHVSEDEIDPKGHHRLQPEVLVGHLRKALKRAGVEAQSLGITYEMRNFAPTEPDLACARMSAEVLAERILAGEGGLASTLRIQEDRVVAGVAPIEKVAAKRYARYYSAARRPLLDEATCRVTDEIGRYYGPLFGDRGDRSQWLPALGRPIRV